MKDGRSNNENDSLYYSLRIHAHLCAAQTKALELHVAIGNSEEGIVLGAHDVLARMIFRAALTNEDISRADELAAEFFNA
jgi:hypothetical protein